MLKRWIMIAVTATTVLVGGPAFAAHKYAKVVIAVPALPGSLEPTQETSIVSLRITYNLYDKLIDFAHGTEGALAQSWHYDDASTLTLKLRPGVTFHNGDALTAEDVAFTFGPDRMSAKTAPAYGATRAYFGNLESVEAVDALTVRMHLKQPDPRFHLKLGIWTGEIISKRAYQQNGGIDGYARRPIGTGPYQLESFRPGESILLRAFDSHYRGAPAAERIEFRLVPEVSTRVAGLLSGEFDIATDVPPDQLGVVEKAAGLRVTGGPILNNLLVAFNQNGTNGDLMKNVHFRRALSLAVDRQLIVDTIWHGRTVVPAGHQWREFGALYIDRPIPAYDPKRAQAELALSGYRGQTIAYPIVDYYTNGVAVSETLAAMWDAVGIKVKMAVVESFAQRDKLKPDLVDWSNSLPYPDAEAGMWRLWKPASITGRGFGWTDADFIRNGEILETSDDVQARRAAHERLLDIWDYGNPGGIILYQTTIFYGQKKTIDWKPLAIQFMDFGPRNLH